MLRNYFRAFVAALIIGIDVALLVIFLNLAGWLEASEPPASVPTPWPTVTPLRTAIPTPTPRTLTIHVVRSGEVLADIAKRYDVAVEDIVKASGITDPNSIRAGQPLTIPVQSAR